MDHKKASFSISLLVITVLFIIAGYFFVSFETKKIEDELHNTLMHATEVLLAALNPERVERFEGSLADLNSPDYIRVKDQTSKLGKIFVEDSVASFYIMRKTNKGVVFLVDSIVPGSEDYSPPGELYIKPSAEIFSVFDDGVPKLVGPYTDEYGTFVSYFAPIRNFSSNKIIGVVGTDIDYNAYVASVRREQILNFLMLFVVYLFCVGIIFFFEKRSEAQKMLRENEERLRVITETTPDAVVMMDDKGIISFWNQAAETLTGYTREEAINKNLHELISPQGLYDIENSKNLHEFMATGKSPILNTIVTIKIKTKEGKEKDVELSTNSLRMKKRWYAIGALRDVSQKKENEDKLKEKTDELEKLNKFMINREQKMIELKAEIEKLKGGKGGVVE